MADVFISYKRERRAAARHLAKILEAYGYTVWFDLALVRGQDYEQQIAAQLKAAKAVIVLWCTKSVASEGVRSESSRAKAAGKLVPLVIEPCELPLFSTNEQHIDLTAATGAPSNLYELHAVLDDVERLVGRAPTPDLRALREYEATWRALGALAFAKLPLEVVPVPEAVIGGAGDGVSTGGGAGSTHDYGFWERQWNEHRAGENLIALQAIAEEAPPYFARLAKARIAEIAAARAAQAERDRVAREIAAQAAREAEAARRRAEEERVAREAAARADAARFAAEGRVWVAAPVVQGAPAGSLAGQSGGWFKPGAGGSEWFRDHPTGPELVVVPAGSFLMGSKDGEGDADERPQHTVTIAQPFAVGRYAVTVGEFAAFVDATKRAMPDEIRTYEGGEWDSRKGRSFRTPGFAQTDRHPVVGVDWDDATAYCTWLSQVTGQTYRLLSEAEWEYACRAVKTPSAPHPKYHFGDDEKQLGAYAWYSANSGGKTHPVGEKLPNTWGLHDMHGNVWEWCADPWHDSYAGAPSDGSAWTTGGDTSRRMLRGGSWLYDPWDLRAADRSRIPAGNRFNIIGFRVARLVSPPRTL
jgi:formylglycine-generating enzyme required for sulfatase activity